MMKDGFESQIIGYLKKKGGAAVAGDVIDYVIRVNDGWAHPVGVSHARRRSGRVKWFRKAGKNVWVWYLPEMVDIGEASMMVMK